MNWTRINPYVDITYWIAGIYKVVSYREGEFHAYYMPDHYKNWGDHAAKPPDDGKHGRCWQSLESAQAACVEHSKRHTPAPKTVKRAAEVVASMVGQSEAA